MLSCEQVAHGDGDTIRALLHDLRGPVGAILNLASSPVGQTERGIRAIAKHAAWLACRVESVLADGSHDEPELVDLGVALERAVALARDRGGPTITLVAGADLCAWARPVALGRALDCVLDNACRAAGPEGNVVVEVAQSSPGQAVISVADDGPGPGQIAPGTSLGLTTTRAMLASCGGSFQLSGRPDGGAVARMMLELAAEERAAG
jgi:signal transduction histidine kinase